MFHILKYINTILLRFVSSSWPDGLALVQKKRKKEKKLTQDGARSLHMKRDLEIDMLCAGSTYVENNFISSA